MDLLARTFLTAAALFLISGTILNLTKHPHWFIRAWDFPRVFISCASVLVAVFYGVLYHETVWDYLLIAGLGFVTARQLYMIYPYTPLAPKTVKYSHQTQRDHQFRLLISNVLMENDQYEKWLQMVRKADPDIIVAVETDQKWVDAVAPLKDEYSNVVEYPLDNYYGMVLLSRLKFENQPEVRFLVQDDVPSIHVVVVLKNGQRIILHAMHPRPPEPVYHQDSAPRDAELVIMGKEVQKDRRQIPTVVCGDLNDVAWSYTTQLFIRISKLLDPRMGRGLYNSFNANSSIFRYPLDHVFHSSHFELVDLQVLEHIGSDHFPVLIHLSCDPEAPVEQEEPVMEESDQEAAEEIVEEQAEREIQGEEKGHIAKSNVSGKNG